VTRPVADLPDAMAAADLVVTAAGTSVWELCAMARPFAAVAVVDNQAVGYDAIVRAGATLGLGSVADVEDSLATAERLRPALRSPEVRQRLAQAAGRVVDAHGAWRVVTSLEEVSAGAADRRVRTVEGLAVRAAGLDDAQRLWEWRNDEQARANSRSHDPVPLDAHLRWLRSSLQRPDRHLLVAEVDGEAVGTVRWDLVAAGEWEVSITVAPQSRGQGLAAPMLEAAQAWLVRDGAEASTEGPDPSVDDRPTMFLAAVHTSNTASRRLFLGAGYLPDLPVDGDGFERFSAWARRPEGTGAMA
jgi:GNAT superfamily N-acetyltransferase